MALSTCVFTVKDSPAWSACCGGSAFTSVALAVGISRSRLKSSTAPRRTHGSLFELAPADCMSEERYSAVLFKGAVTLRKNI